MRSFRDFGLEITSSQPDFIARVKRFAREQWEFNRPNMTSPCSQQLFRVAAVSLFLAASVPVFASEPSGWLEVHSSHFTVFTDAGEKKGREVALRFEQMRAVFANLLTRDHLNQPVPLTILAFNNDKNYYQLAPLHKGQPIDVPAFLLPGEDQDFIALNLSEEESWHAVAHDLAHMFLNYNYPPAQLWFDEGLAEYFGSIRVDNRQVEMGGDPELGSSEKSLTELLNSEQWIPLPELFAIRRGASKLSEDSHHTLFYAESWMVMHYLIHEKRLPDTGSYFDLVVNQHLPIEDALQKAFGISSSQLEVAVQQYFHSLTALQTALEASHQKVPNTKAPPQPYQSGALVSPDDSAIVSKPYPDADARALCAGIQVRIPERRDLGLAQLKKLTTTPTASDIKTEAKNEALEKRDTGENTLPSMAIGNALAHRMLAWDEIQHAEFDDALVELGDAAALNQRDMWVRFYLSLLKYRMAQAKHSDIAGLPNMMLDLRAVLEWYPEFADAYDLLAMARNEGGSTPTAMQSERAAMTLSPRNDMYGYHLALIYIAGKKWEAAKDRLEHLKTSGDPEVAKLATDRLDEMANQRKYGLAAVGSSQPQFAPQKSPFDVLDEDAAKRAAADKQQQAGTADKRATKFLRGKLVAINCSEAPAAVLTVTSEGIVLKLRVVDYKSVLLIGADDFSCDWRNRQVTVNYKPGGLSDGDVVSLEMR